MDNASRESLEDFIKRRMAEIDEDVRKYGAMISSLEAERRKLELALTAAMSLGPPAQIEPGLGTKDRIADIRRSRPVASEKTIKEAVLEVLREHRRGMTALEILPAINARLGVDYPRTSLSPQLSRLKNERKLERNGVIWSLPQPKRALDLGGLDDTPESEPTPMKEGPAFE